MRSLLIVLHVLVCFILILVVLLQAGRGASMGAAFGGSSQTLFGSAGAGTFLGKMTTV
ncbi:MAG: preprotein translocase subunit SecG, partial [Syntrophaceae bacterium]|nr:preprotein translocase subunit SecG [Syntrophaceae bacterium]